MRAKEMRGSERGEDVCISPLACLHYRDPVEKKKSSQEEGREREKTRKRRVLDIFLCVHV
jgi:hypothetical protein